MKNKLLLFPFIIFSKYAASQHLFWVDSVRAYPLNPTTNDSIHVLIAGKFSDTGVRISNVVTTVSTDTVTLDFYETYCSGFDVIIPFDTTVNIGQLTAGNYFVRYRGIIDTNTVDTIYCFTVPNFIPYDSVGVNISVLPTGIASLKLENEINIFPNPTSGQLTISSSSAEGLIRPGGQFPINEIEIYNSLGRIVHTQATLNDHSAFQTTIDVSKLPSGIYFVKVTAGEKILVGKFIKE